MEKFTRLIAAGAREGVSDLHITGDHPVVSRKNGTISFNNALQWSHEEIDHLIQELLSYRQLQTLRSNWSVDLALSINHIRVRMNIFSTTRGLSMAVRLLPGAVPSLNSLNLHPSLQQICTGTRAGLILICGATGSGKSTTIAAMVDEINRTRSDHVITLEDPIEFRFVSKKSFVEQRELGTHMPSFEQGLMDVLREAPDVIVVGELREPETIRLTLNAAESGHLVIASLHGSNSEDALYRLCNSFSAEGQEVVRTQMASTLAWLIVQQLSYHNKVGFRVPVLSILRGTPAIRGMIRENRLSQIEGAIQTGRAEGMFTMDAYSSEYLSKRQFFTPPADSFKPSAEATTEVPYRSTLIDPQAAGARSAKRVSEQGTVPGFPGAQNPVVDEDGRNYYVIEEEARVDELIYEMTRNGGLVKE